MGFEAEAVDVDDAEAMVEAGPTLGVSVVTDAKEELVEGWSLAARLASIACFLASSASLFASSAAVRMLIAVALLSDADGVEGEANHCPAYFIPMSA